MVRMVELKGISIKVLMKKVFIVLLAMGVMLSNLINVKFAFAKSCDQYIRAVSYTHLTLPTIA